VTAVLRLEVVGDIGYLFLLEGELVHASTLELEGESALASMLGWHDAKLAWCERRWPRERTIHRPWTELAPTEASPGLAAEHEQEPAPTPEPEPEPEPEPVSEVAPVQFPSAMGIRQVLSRADFRNAVRLNAIGNVSDSRGSTAHLKPILRSSVTLGDSLGAALGIGPLLAAEASAPGFHRVLARSSEDMTAVETAGGSGLSLARAFLKL
jgi:hypothetical protein